MTTRRLRPPGAWRGRTGLFGLFPSISLGISHFLRTSVEASQLLIDPDRCSERPGESAVRGGALEALEPSARVDASPWRLRGPESAPRPGRRSGSARPSAPSGRTRRRSGSAPSSRGEESSPPGDRLLDGHGHLGLGGSLSLLGGSSATGCTSATGSSCVSAQRRGRDLGIDRSTLDRQRPRPEPLPLPRARR